MNFEITLSIVHYSTTDIMDIKNVFVQQNIKTPETIKIN